MRKAVSITIIIFILNSMCLSAYGACMECNPKIICHRGLSAYEPENTIPAFKACTDKSIYGIECDIHETKDNEFVIIHDEEVDRTTNGTGKIENMTLKEIKELIIDSGTNINKYENLKIPTLEEYINICNEINKVPVIEIKNIKKNSIGKFIEILKDKGIYDKAIIISSDKNLLCMLRRNFSQVKIQWLCAMNSKNINICKKYNFHIDVEKSDFNLSLLKYAHENNIKVNVWTIDDENTFYEFQKYGIDYVTTNGEKN